MIINRLKSVLMNCLLINCDKDIRIQNKNGKIKVVVQQIQTHSFSGFQKA